MKTLMVDPASIQDLVARAREGDRSAFERLVKTFEVRVSQFIASRSRLHIGPGIEVDEIRQETFSRAYESIARFQLQGEDSLFQWLCGIARHVLPKVAERSRKSQRIESASGLPASDASPSTALRRDERFARLQGAIDDLPRITGG
jgi:RNA polymerase sigma-70 factor (ECF subfamily)